MESRSVKARTNKKLSADGIANIYITSNFEEHSLTIQNFNVDYIYRGQGIGNFVLKYLIEKTFKDPRYELIKLEDRTGSIQLNPGGVPNKMYLKFGFIHTNPNHPFYKDDMILTRERYNSFTRVNPYYISI